jgi:hypothetical protein
MTLDRPPLTARAGRRPLLAAAAATAVGLAGCAAPAPSAPPAPLTVHVTGVQRVAADPMVLRLDVQLSVQNPDDRPLPCPGLNADLSLLSGAKVGSGTVPFGGVLAPRAETTLHVPVTVTGFGEIRRATGLYGSPDRRLDVIVRGVLCGATVEGGGTPFEWRGELALPLPSGT